MTMARARYVPLVLGLLLIGLTLPSCGSDNKTPEGGFPEDQFTYAVSRFTIPQDPENRGESMRQVLLAIEELRSGMPFLEVARRRSGTGKAVRPHGWMGFVRPERPDPLMGAIQALQPGQYSGPVEQDQATNFIYRHTFAEGRQIESERVIPAYGFVIPNDPQNPDPAMQNVRPRAQEAWEKVNRGELTLAAASEEFGVSVTRPDAFLEILLPVGPRAELYAMLAKVEPGELAPLGEMDGALFFARRGVHLRSHVRHVLIQHVESRNRPLTVSRSKADARALAEKVLAEVRDGTLEWDQAVRRHSDEVQTLALNGWIGAVTNGDLIPEFEAAVLATEPGGIADEIVESGDGFHILYRVN